MAPTSSSRSMQHAQHRPIPRSRGHLIDPSKAGLCLRRARDHRHARSLTTAFQEGLVRFALNLNGSAVDDPDVHPVRRLACGSLRNDNTYYYCKSLLAIRYAAAFEAGGGPQSRGIRDSQRLSGVGHRCPAADDVARPIQNRQWTRAAGWLATLRQNSRYPTTQLKRWRSRTSG